MKAVILLVLLAVAAASPLSDVEYEGLFTSWMGEHQKEYTSAQELFQRYHVWRDNMDYIISHNLKNKSWFLKMNEFGDMTNTEFVSRFNNYKATNATRRHMIRQPTKVDVPASINWTALGKVTPIKNQGQCGSCWAFSTTGSVEGAWAMKHPLTSLSEQELVDCAGSTGNQGCNGGEMQAAMQWIINNNGICSESSYPYQGVDGTCQSTSCKNVVTISSYVNVNNDEGSLKDAVAITPVSVAVDASGSDWQFYGGGIVNDPNCYNQLDHGVLAVGYGTQNSQDYWIVKNSWGRSWGMNGYILLARNVAYSGGECGITLDASYPVV